jgi:hypothetical protein
MILNYCYFSSDTEILIPVEKKENISHMLIFVDINLFRPIFNLLDLQQ